MYHRDMDTYKTFAVVNTIEAARVACRDLAISRKDDQFFFDDTREENKWWKESFDKGVYDSNDLCDYSKHSIKIWFEGPMKVKTVNDFPQHLFEADKDDDDDEDDGPIDYHRSTANLYGY